MNLANTNQNKPVFAVLIWEQVNFKARDASKNQICMFHLI